MSLVIFVSQKTVILSKYNLEFRFNPPAPNLTKAALGAYQLLKQSEVLQTESSRDQKDEVITLLKHYGQALYNSIVPEQSRSQVYKAGGIFIYSLEKDIVDLPWELMYDGASFFALTQGVIRIHKSDAIPTEESSVYMFPSLRLSLNSYLPFDQQEVNPRFSAYIEEIAAKAVPKSPLIDLKVNGNASRTSISQSLDQSPNIFFFTGYDSEEGWILEPDSENPGSYGWTVTELKPKLMKAVKDGLKMVVLQTSFLLNQPNTIRRSPIRFFFDCGVPYVIAIQGRLARKRLLEYLNIFLLNLVREENISRAHRLAINHIQATLPLSWDWSWIRFHINQKILESASEQPLPPFHFNRSIDAETAIETAYPYKHYLPHRRFYGKYSVLHSLTEAINAAGSKKIICLRAADGQPIDSYLGEWLRRAVTKQLIAISTTYYQRWGMSSETSARLQSSKFAKLFSFLIKEHQLVNHFEKSLISQNQVDVPKQSQKLLLVYTPPEKPDHEFDNWIGSKQNENWQIFYIYDQTFWTRHGTVKIDLAKTGQVQVINSFEDSLPEKWIDLVESDFPSCMEDVALLNILKQSGDSELINYVDRSVSLDQLYKKGFETVLADLAVNRLKLFVYLFLMRIACPKDLLTGILSVKGVEQDIKHLYDGHLIEANLEFDMFWIPAHLYHHVQRLNLVPKKTLLSMGQELLQQLIAYQKDNFSQLRYIESGFQYCLLHLVQLDDLEYPLQRNLQFGKKQTRKFQNAFRYAQNMVTSLELALKTRKGHLIQKAMFSLVEILEELPYEKETIAICDWLMKIEKKHRNWPLVSEIQTRMASIFAALNKKEKAIGLISSALKLNNDIKNFAGRYKNLISIALLLLDLGEYDKLNKLLTSANFDMSLLNREDVARLWLIDGHMLYHNKKLKEAESSFNKVINHTSLSVADSLLAKTYLYLAEIHNNRGDYAAYVKNLKKALDFVQASGDQEKTAALHEELYELLISQDEVREAVSHLEWLYYFYRENGNKAQIRKAADLLGGLYFKIGEHAKSTELYSVAQGI